MTQHQLTPEQEQVIQHPLGFHARVLAVAGSGKSTTMAHRIRHLVQDCHVRPSTIQVLMFNALARKQFAMHLTQVGLPEAFHPSVHTFHSFSFHILKQTIKDGILPVDTQFWLTDKAKLIWLTVKRAINNLEKDKHVPPESVDPEEALYAISVWKGSLIPPERAGSYSAPYLPLVYMEHQRLQRLEKVITFDDFIPTAISLIESSQAIRGRFCQEVQHLIVDEYQDINYGQQRLIEVIAGSRADIMVVGDDDQTIYEWRGARPQYILHDFGEVFKAKPLKEYRLSRSFRFGPLIAQCAANIIACNVTRLDKPLVAYQSCKHGFVNIFQGEHSATQELAEQVQTLLQSDGVIPQEIIVLARLYAQLDNLEAEFLARQIPYRVDGQEPFFKRQEINTLLDYIRLAYYFTKPLSEQSGGWFLNIANKPSRMLSRSVLSKLVSTARYRRLSTHGLFELVASDHTLGLSPWQAERLNELWGFLETLQCKLQDPTEEAGNLLEWMVDDLHFLDYFQNYYGKGEHADEKKFAVQHFIGYVGTLHLPPISLLERLKKLDTTQGKPDSELVLFTTIFRTKGLEYDYVVIPQCDDNLLPYLKGERIDLFDKQGLVRESQMSSKLESERRLFYVALTRARMGVLIGASSNPSRFLEELHLSETEAVMRVLVQLAAGDVQAQQTLQLAIQRGVVPPVALHNLIFGYLPDLGYQALADELRKEWTLPAPVHKALASY